MAVYVDDVRHRYGRMIMCHMWADTEAELLEMADAIGVARRWLQEPPKASWVHFDIALTKKAEAIKCGAILTDKYGPVLHVARQRLDHSSEVVRARSKKQIDRIEALRLRRAHSAPLPTGGE